MLIDFIATIAAGFVGAGVALLLRHLSRGALPRAFIPIVAGLSMLGLTIWSEYSWFGRTAGTLPPEVVVVSSHSEPSWYRPWTYAEPFVSRFMAIDRAAIRTNESVPGQRMAEVLIFRHREPPSKFPLLVDCTGMRRADIVDGMTFDDAGAVIDADWREMPADDPLLGAICS